MPFRNATDQHRDDCRIDLFNSLSPVGACRVGRRHAALALAFRRVAPGSCVFQLAAYNWGMIRASHRRCFCCQVAIATRMVPDRDGRQIPLCGRCPSPTEIDARAKVIAWSWTDDERYSRHFGILARHIDSHRAVRLDRVYELACD